MQVEARQLRGLKSHACFLRHVLPLVGQQQFPPHEGQLLPRRRLILPRHQ